MKKTFIKFLPFAAAVLLATSCGKDDNSDNNVVNPNSGTEVVTPEKGVETVPFTVKVGTNGKISKIAYSGADGTGNVTPTFEVSEVEHLTMTVTGEGVNTTLTLKDADGTFSGEITAGLADDFDLTATITIDGDATSSTTGLGDLMKNCGHVYSQSFKYGDVTSGNKIMLVDNKSYIEVSWTNKGGQNVTISEQTYTLNSDGKIWIAVAAGSNIVSDDLDVSSTTTVAGDIYTINRTFKNITLNKTTASVALGKTETLTATTVPDGETVTWASSDETVATVANGVVTPIKEGTTTITATFGELSATCTVTVIPAGYVDLGVICNNQHIYFKESNLYDNKPWNELTGDEKDNMPKVAEWTALKEQCYWHCTSSGYNVFKVHDAEDAGNGTYNNYTPNKTYSTDTDPYIFLSVTPDWGSGYYWSGESAGDYGAFCLRVNETDVLPELDRAVECGFSVRLVRRSN